MTIEELHELTGRAVAGGDGHLTVMVPSPKDSGYAICTRASFERIWLDTEKGIVPADPGVNVLLLTAKAA